VLRAPQVVALMPRVLTSLVATHVAAIAAMTETVKPAQVFRYSLYIVFIGVNLYGQGDTSCSRVWAVDAKYFVPEKWSNGCWELHLLHQKIV